MLARSRRPAFAPTVLAAHLAVICLLAAPAGALDPGGIEAHELQNGMQVILWPDHSIPNLTLYTFYRVGSRNERPGITGLSHFFEHMMFLGSKSYAPGEFDQVMEAAGGSNNAYTSRDVTVYQDWFPRSAMQTIFELEADRIASLAIDPGSVESERGVVAAERRRSVEDNNVRALAEENWAAAYKAHPYQWPVIGWMVDIQNWKSEDLYDYFKTFYAPNNATAVVVGDFEPDEMLELFRTYLEPIPRGPAPPAVTTAEPQQSGERRTELRREAQVASIISSWHVPSTAHEDVYALWVLETLLLDGESSRAHRRLVEEDEKALRIWGGFSYSMDPTLFQVYMQVRQGVDPADCESALYEEIERVLAEPPDERELRKAKNQITADHYRGLQTISGKANALGYSAVYLGDPKAFLNLVDEIEAVTVEDLQRVVRAWFTKSNRTVSVLVPKGTDETKQAAQSEVGS
jgi:zinc protease